jgi:hypothetical protein
MLHNRCFFAVPAPWVLIPRSWGRRIGLVAVLGCSTRPPIQLVPYFVHASTAHPWPNTALYGAQARWVSIVDSIPAPKDWDAKSGSGSGRGIHPTRDRRYICPVFYFEALRILQNFQCVLCGIRVSKAAAAWAGGFRGGH